MVDSFLMQVCFRSDIRIATLVYIQYVMLFRSRQGERASCHQSDNAKTIKFYENLPSLAL